MHQTPPSDSTTLITYQPQLLVAAQAPHGSQRYPASSEDSRLYAAPAACTPGRSIRSIRVMRFDSERTASVSIVDQGLDVSIELAATTLRTLAYQLLDAAHDIEHAPKALEQAAFGAKGSA